MLRPFVETLWAIDEAEVDSVSQRPAARERVLPTGQMHLAFRFSGGPHRIFDDPDDPTERLVELDFNGHTLMLADEFPEFGITGPSPDQGTSVTIHLHVDDADAVVRQAMAAGATLEREPTDEFYGERTGVIRDPFGRRWSIGHRIEDVSPEEMQRRYTRLLQANA